MKTRWKLTCVALSVILFAPLSALGGEKSVIVYILGGSGSMWGRVDGKIKIQATKEVMSTLIKETPDGIDCGVMVEVEM
jgi:hypothetical protein